ncbi:NAD-dependent epimerase/dehydratase family protein, partial [Candidatus Williamhamiltonella defendens]
DNSHVLPALLSRFHQAKLLNSPEVTVWGTGEAKREFLHVDDMAAASVYIMELDSDVYRANTQPMLSHINVGSGEEVTIRALAELIAKVV